MQSSGSVSRLRQFLSYKWVKAILIIDLLAIILIIIAIVFAATKTATVNFNITPVSAKIQLDGQGEYYNGSYQLHPGAHTATVSYDGFTPKTLTINLEPGYTTTVATFLTPIDGSLNFYEQKANSESLQKLMEIASQTNNQTTDHDTSAEAFITKYNQKTSISNFLPLYQQVGLIETDFITPIFISIDTDTDGTHSCQQSFCLVISDTTEQHYTDAINLIKSKGYNPDDYEIIYTNERILPTGVITE